MAIHVVLPDTQVAPGVPIDHFDWIGEFIVENFADEEDVKIIHLGDHFDMPSLSSYDKGRPKSMEGRRYLADIEAGNEAFAKLNGYFTRFNKRRRKSKAKLWEPRKIFLFGNHEDRITRASEADAQLDGLLSLESCNTLDWERHDFLVPVFVDGVGYSHYFPNPLTGKPHGGTINNKLNKIGHSFVMGHVQTFEYGQRWVRDHDGRPLAQHGIVAGSCYLHNEEYRGQANETHWRGILVLRNVEKGDFDLETISLRTLGRLYG